MIGYLGNNISIKKLIKIRFLVKLIYKIIYFSLRKLLRNINVEILMGISIGQLASLKKDFNLKSKNEIILPNTRPKLNFIPSYQSNSFSGVLWVGNFMNGRDISMLCKYINKYNFSNDKKLKIYFIGNIFDKSYFKYVMKNNYVVYLGGFKNDNEIYDKIKNLGLVGFFFGWFDKYKTMINVLV